MRCHEAFWAFVAEHGSTHAKGFVNRRHEDLKKTNLWLIQGKQGQKLRAEWMALPIDERKALMSATPDPTFPAETDGIIDERFANIGASVEHVVEPEVLCASEPAVDNLIGRNDDPEFEKLWLDYRTAKRQYLRAIRFDCLAKLTQARRSGDAEVVETLVLQLVDCAVAELLPSLGGEQCGVVSRVFRDCVTGIKSTRTMALLHTREEEDKIAEHTNYDLQLAKEAYDRAKTQASTTTQFEEVLTAAAVDYRGDGIFSSWDWVGRVEGMRIPARACVDDQVIEGVVIDSHMHPAPLAQKPKRRSKRKKQRSATSIASKEVLREESKPSE